MNHQMKCSKRCKAPDVVGDGRLHCEVWENDKQLSVVGQHGLAKAKQLDKITDILH